jgi:creatinine amidohydrolase/Fe(II)-dependent formamide hydrolase-like protein
MARKVGRELGDLTFPDVGRRLNSTSIMLLPLGAFEQHGAHLPLNTDAVIAEALSRRIVARWGEELDLWQLPTVAIGVSREHDWAPGTLCLSIEQFVMLIRQLAREIVRALPARNLVVLNGHGGNRGVLDNLLRDFAELGLNACAVHPFDLARVKPRSAGIDVHGGESETAVMLALAPQLVRREAIVRATAPVDPSAIAALVFDRGASFPWRSDDARLARQGVIGAAHLATPELGRRIVDSIVKEAGAVCRRLLDNQRHLQGASVKAGAAPAIPAAPQPRRRASPARTSRRSGNRSPPPPRRKS